MTFQHQWQIVIFPRARRVHKDRKSIRELIALEQDEDLVESVILHIVIIFPSSQEYDVSIDKKYQWICDFNGKVLTDNIKRVLFIHVL